MRRLTSHILDSYQSTDQIVQLYESIGCGNLDLRLGCLPFSILHLICHGQVLSLRVEQPSSLSSGLGYSREPIFGVEQFLVHHWHLFTTRFRVKP